MVESQLLYAAPVWASTINATAKFRQNLVRPQRIAALKTIRTYRTVFGKAASLLAGMPPVYLIAKERTRVKAEDPLPGAPTISRVKTKKLERKTTIAEWHRR